jgi:hypothetical protein
MSLSKRLHQLYQDKLLNPLYRRRLNNILTTLHQNTMTFVNPIEEVYAEAAQSVNEDQQAMDSKANRIRFGIDTIESLEEKKREERLREERERH